VFHNTSIPDLKKPESKNNSFEKRKIKRRREKKERRICRSKKDRKEKTVKKSDGKKWFGG